MPVPPVPPLLAKDSDIDGRGEWGHIRWRVRNYTVRGLLGPKGLLLPGDVRELNRNLTTVKVGFVTIGRNATCTRGSTHLMTQSHVSPLAVEQPELCSGFANQERIA